MTKRPPLKYFETLPKIIRRAVVLYGGFSLSLRNVKDLLQEKSVENSHETVWFWWRKCGPELATSRRKQCSDL